MEGVWIEPISMLAAGAATLFAAKVVENTTAALERVDRMGKSVPPTVGDYAWLLVSTFLYGNIGVVGRQPADFLRIGIWGEQTHSTST